jgi:hypothetical protein
MRLKVKEETNNKESRKNRKSHGRYANYFEIGHNAYEFILDFGQMYQCNEVTGFHTRIITSPVYARSLLISLKESISNYEQNFGKIDKEIE